MKTKILTILCFLTTTLFISLPVKAISQNEHSKNYSVSLKKLCYVNLYKGFTEFSNNLSSVNIQQYKEKIKKLGINKFGNNRDYTKVIPSADIMATNDKLGLAINSISQSLIKLNKVRKACSDELDEYRFRD